MAGRMGRLILVLALAMTLAIAPAVSRAENGLVITNVIQNGGEVIVYLNLFDSTINSARNNLSAGNYILSGAGVNTPASSVTDVGSLNVRTDYTILCDATLGNSINGTLISEVIKFAKTMHNERVRLFYYDEQGVFREQEYTSRAEDLDQQNGNKNTKLMWYTRNNVPSTNSALLFTLQRIAQDTDFRSASVRHAVIVLTDTDAENVDANVTQVINQLHIPVFSVFIGNSASSLQQYATVSGGALMNTTAGNISTNLNSVRSMMNSAVILRFKPDYALFAAGNVSLTVSVAGAGKDATSLKYNVSLSTNNVPTPVPSTAPTQPATESPIPATATPRPTVPPVATETPYITPEPTPEPTGTPEVIVMVVTPDPTDSPEPTFTPAPPTVPPTNPPTEAPVATPEPTETPASGGLMDTINETLGEDGIWIVGAGALFIVAVIILLVIFLGSRKKKAKGAELQLRDLSYPSKEDGEATTYSKGGMAGPDGEATTYSKGGAAGGGDGEATTYSKGVSMSGSSGSYGGSVLDGGDMEKTTSPFSRPAIDQYQQQQPMFGGANENMDFGDKTVAVSSFGDDGDKTVRIQDNSGLKMKFTAESNGRTNVYMASVQHKIIVGRGADCDVCISDSSVSKHHIEISYESDGLYVRDLGSSNGTMLNGAKVNGSTPLRSNDVLVLGYSKVTVEVLA